MISRVPFCFFLALLYVISSSSSGSHSCSASSKRESCSTEHGIFSLLTPNSFLLRYAFSSRRRSLLFFRYSLSDFKLSTKAFRDAILAFNSAIVLAKSADAIVMFSTVALVELPIRIALRFM